jgi:hypothetical protein
MLLRVLARSRLESRSVRGVCAPVILHVAASPMFGGSLVNEDLNVDKTLRD